MPALYYANVTLHVLAAMLWLGGMFFWGIVGAPLLCAIEPGELRQRLFQAIGERFRAVGWWTIAVLLARVNAIVGVLVVAAAVRLARGG
jgi:putative copper resistance protein D